MVLLTIKGVAARLGMSESFVRNLIRGKKLRVVRLGRHVKVDLTDLEDCLRRCKENEKDNTKAAA